MKVDRKAWKPGALWRTTSERGTLEATVMGYAVGGNARHKLIQMVYLDGRWKGRIIQQDYTHDHMLKHFTFTGEFRPIPDRLKDCVACNFISHCEVCGGTGKVKS